MQFQIDLSSRVPIYRQLAGQLREAVAREAPPEERLPSVRESRGRWWSIRTPSPGSIPNWNAKGILNTRPGLGVFVARPKDELTRKVRRERLDDLLDRFLTEAVHLGFSAEEVLGCVAQRVKQFHWHLRLELPPAGRHLDSSRRPMVPT